MGAGGIWQIFARGSIEMAWVVGLIKHFRRPIKDDQGTKYEEVNVVTVIQAMYDIKLINITD